MTAQTTKKQSVDTTRVGEHSPAQPVSGIKTVQETGAVNGLGHGAYLRMDDDAKKKTKH